MDGILDGYPYIWIVSISVQGSFLEGVGREHVMTRWIRRGSARGDLGFVCSLVVR